MRRAISTASAVAIAALIASVAAHASLSATEAKRVQAAATVLTEIQAAPDKGIPLDLWNKASCVAVVPGLKKGALVFGGEFGKGLLACRHGNAWSAPVFMELERGSWGFQIGAQSVDLVLLVMNDAVGKLLGDKVTLGGDASAAAGPVGRDARAATDAQMKAEILSYSRTQGLFAGIDVSGGVLRPDKSDNTDLYGSAVTPRHVLLDGTIAPPAETLPFVHSLERGGVGAKRAP